MQCSILRCEVAKRLCSVQCCIKPCSTTRCSGMRHANANNRIQSKVTQSYTETKCKRNVSNGSEPMHCKEMQRADSNAVQSDAESGWNEVQDGARWCKMEPDGTGWNWTSLKQSPALSLSDSWHSCAGQGTGELGPWVHNLWKKMGLGQVNGIEMAAGWVSMCFNVSRCCQNVSPFQCWPLQKIASLFLWFFWLQQLCCALKDSLRFQHWLLKARLAALMLGRTSTIIQFDDGIIELEPLKIFENCHLLLPWFPCLATRPCLVLHSLSIQDQIVGLSLHQFGSG